MCGVVITTEGDRVVDIRGDPQDPLSKGYVCPKVVGLGALHEDPDRLRRPLVREGRQWREVGWGEALDRAARGLRDAARAHGRDAVGAYQGNPTIHNLDLLTYGQLLMRRLRTRRRFSATSVDQLPHMLAALQMFGNQLLMPVPDVERADLWILLGANPAVSHGSLMSGGDPKRRIRELRARGGRVVVLDPRRTETAKLADEHHFVRPGSDALLLLAWVNVVFAEGLARPGALGDHLDGLEVLRRAAAPYTPERVASVVGLPAESIGRLARELAAAERAVCYGRVGISVHEFGGLCAWLLYALNALTGHLDAPGGYLFTSPAIDLAALAERFGERGGFGRYGTSSRGLPEFGGELPVAALAEEIEAGAVRALLTSAGNPVLSAPNGSRLERALAGLDFMVSIDPYLNETTRHAHVLLPPASPLTRDHYDVALHAFAVRNAAKFGPRVFERAADERGDWEICLGLWSRIEAPGRVLPAILRGLVGREPRRWLDLLLRTGPERLSVARLLRAPSGIDLGPLRPTLVSRLRGRRIDLAPQVFLDDLPRLEATLDAPAPPLVLIGRRQLRSNNSWMHNLRPLVKGPARCTLQVHPDDVARLGLSKRARVESAVGAVEVPVEPTEDVMPGVVSLPHGWGHSRPDMQMQVAAAHAGASANDVVDDARVDALSGTAALNGQPVTVSPA